MFANIVVNTAVLVSMRMKDDAGKVAAIIFIIFIFAFLGYEHVIANFPAFTLAFWASGGHSWYDCRQRDSQSCLCLYRELYRWRLDHGSGLCMAQSIKNQLMWIKRRKKQQCFFLKINIDTLKSFCYPC